MAKFQKYDCQKYFYHKFTWVKQIFCLFNILLLLLLLWSNKDAETTNFSLILIYNYREPIFISCL